MSLSGLMDGTELYPYQVNWFSDEVCLLAATPDFYERAAFLDQRALGGQQAPGHWVPMAAVRAEASRIKARHLGLIFHVGHCGSTLISRLLGLAGTFFSLREPLPLRDLAGMWAERDAPWAPFAPDRIMEHLGLLRSLWARSPRDGQLAILKATSFCSLLAREWLTRFPEDRALLLSVAPEIYLATVLSSPGHITDLVGGAKPRIASLMEATGADIEPLHTLAAGEVAALGYLAELVNLERAALARPGQALRLDFDAFLADPGPAFAGIARHFGRQPGPEETAGILADPLFTRYSKATEFPYSHRDRQQQLDDSRAANLDQIRTGLEFMRRFVRDHALAGEALRNFDYAL